ncbi:hypothetical protein [Burkholderia cenocepacia]|uniref:hypothetical protein n=1 Tax=Burkholderia cenocepacia TaxID=95486 RepID=UPI002AB08ECF|nr:hypothetical protein [Burkholderia cenocepacia]
MADNDNEIHQLRMEFRDSLTHLNVGIGEIRSTLTQFIERITRLEERSERIPALEKRVDALDAKLEPIRDEVVSAAHAAKWANKLAKWIMPLMFTGLTAGAGLYIKDNVSKQLQPVVAEVNDIQRQQQVDIADIRAQLQQAQAQPQSRARH